MGRFSSINPIGNTVREGDVTLVIPPLSEGWGGGQKVEFVIDPSVNLSIGLSTLLIQRCASLDTPTLSHVRS